MYMHIAIIIKRVLSSYVYVYIVHMTHIGPTIEDTFKLRYGAEDGGEMTDHACTC